MKSHTLNSQIVNIMINWFQFVLWAMQGKDVVGILNSTIITAKCNYEHNDTVT